MEQYKTYTFTVDGVPHTMLESQYDVTSYSPSGAKWAVCSRCEYTDKADAMLKKGSRYYCYKYGCAEGE